MSFVITREKGAVFVKGAIDDGALFGAISSMSGSVTLNFRGVTSINSVGARKFLDFVASWKSLKVAYEDCPHVLVDAFLMVPSLLGPAENTAQIVSLQVAFECPRCRESHDLFVKTDDLRLKGKDLAFPVRVCPGCSGYLSVDPAAAQLAALVELGALTVKAAK